MYQGMQITQWMHKKSDDRRFQEKILEKRKNKVLIDSTIIIVRANYSRDRSKMNGRIFIIFKKLSKFVA